MAVSNISTTGKIVLKLIGSAFVVIAFVIIVLTAVAQQEVLGVLGKAEPDVGYSSAYAAFDTIDGRTAEVGSLRYQEAQDLSQVRRAEAHVLAAKTLFEDDWNDFLPVAAEIQQSGKCNLRFDTTATVGGRMTEWQDAQRCSATGLLPSPVNQKFTAFANGSENLDRATAGLSRALSNYQDLSNDLNSVRASIKAATTLSPDEQKTMQIFSETNVLRKNQLLGGSMLLQFPPPMLQILLAFASGSFGALLITLILVVYPNNQFTFSGSASVGPRIMLGGMIAMCVYIVLLGGTAVLGASSGITAAGTNYMAFCAIAILAGMFSDRVAFWLSDRANAFFKGGAAGGGGAGGGGARAASPTSSGAAIGSGPRKPSGAQKPSGTVTVSGGGTPTGDSAGLGTDEEQPDAKPR